LGVVALMLVAMVVVAADVGVMVIAVRNDY
jgi:hypothetical protein